MTNSGSSRPSRLISRLASSESAYSQRDSLRVSRNQASTRGISGARSSSSSWRGRANSAWPLYSAASASRSTHCSPPSASQGRISARPSSAKRRSTALRPSLSSSRTGRLSGEIAASSRRSRRACSPARAAARGSRAAERRCCGSGRPADRLPRLATQPCSLQRISRPSSKGSSWLNRGSSAPASSMLVTSSLPARTAGRPVYFSSGRRASFFTSDSATASGGNTMFCFLSSSPMAAWTRYMENSSV
ncbi:hypothetical protein D9M68_385590 [compost metagenome]